MKSDRFRGGFQRFERLPAMDDRHLVDFGDPQENEIFYLFPRSYPNLHLLCQRHLAK